MTPEFSTALTLLVVGMVTVFLVLLLVVTTGNLLISFVNRYAEEQPEKSQNQSILISWSGIGVSSASTIHHHTFSLY